MQNTYRHWVIDYGWRRLLGAVLHSDRSQPLICGAWNGVRYAIVYRFSTSMWVGLSCRRQPAADRFSILWTLSCHAIALFVKLSSFCGSCSWCALVLLPMYGACAFNRMSIWFQIYIICSSVRCGDAQFAIAMLSMRRGENMSTNELRRIRLWQSDRVVLLLCRKWNAINRQFWFELSGWGWCMCGVTGPGRHGTSGWIRTWNDNEL